MNSLPITSTGKLVPMPKKRSNRERTPFGLRLLRAREAAGLTQKQVQAKLGIGQTTLSEAEGAANTSGFTAQMAALYGVDANWLATGAGVPPDWWNSHRSSEGPESGTEALSMSHLTRYRQSTFRVEVPVRLTARPTPAGGLSVEDQHAGGGVEAPHASPEAFAIKIVGDLLYPAVKHGMFMVCDPAAPCVAGEPVLLELADGSLQVRELVFDRADEVTTLSLLGCHRETLRRDGIRKMTAITAIVYPSRWRAADAAPH